jgi:hypothetical protein
MRSNAGQLAQIISVLGLPVNWIGDATILSYSFEELRETFPRDEKSLFVQFLPRTLRWIPREWASAAELLDDYGCRRAPDVRSTVVEESSTYLHN